MTQDRIWQNIETVEIDELIKAREQLHQAVQIVAMVARSLLPKVTDDRYANLEWSGEYQALNGRCVLDDTLRVALRVKDFTLLIFDHSGIRCELALDGQTQEQAIEFLKDELSKFGADVSKLTLELPYEIPEYETAKGIPFKCTSYKAFEILSKYFDNAELAISKSVKEEHSVTEIRSWPHHFDIATLIIIEAHEDPEEAKTIGVGFSPGDEHFASPYFYITPWPYPDVSKVSLPTLPAGGQWHTEGWVGALLQGTEITHLDHQELGVEQFMQEAIKASKSFI